MTKSQDTEPESPENDELRATELVRDGHSDEALKVLKAARARSSDDWLALYRIGRLLIRLRKPLDALDAAIALQPDFAQAHYERGTALGTLGEREKMQDAYERTIALLAHHADALAGLALIAARSGETEKCRRYATAAIEATASCTVCDFDKSIKAVCRFVGIDWNQGMRDFASASEVIDPRSRSARQVRGHLYSGGIGQWRRYRQHLAPVFPVLAPWIERFGYAAD